MSVGAVQFTARVATYTESAIAERSFVVIRVGIVGFDSSHVVDFTMRLNHVGIEEEQSVDGA